MHRVRLLKHYGITPYVVFDGGPLPSKIRVEKDREQYVRICNSGCYSPILLLLHRLRTAALSRARALTAEGRHAEARDSYVKAVDVSPQMAYQLIKVRGFHATWRATAADEWFSAGVEGREY